MSEQMRSSWTRFVIGFLAGTAALWLLFQDTPYPLLSFLLLYLSLGLMRPKAHSATAPKPEPAWSSDREEWHQLGRDLIKVPGDIVVPVAVSLALFYAWKLAVRLEPALADLGKPLALIALTAYWLMHVVLGVSRRQALPRNPQQSAGGMTP